MQAQCNNSSSTSSLRIKRREMPRMKTRLMSSIRLEVVMKANRSLHSKLRTDRVLMIRC